MDGWQDFHWGMNHSDVLELVRHEHPEIQESLILINDQSIPFTKAHFAKIPLLIGYFQFDNLELFAVDFIFKKQKDEESTIEIYKRLSILIDRKIGKEKIVYEGQERREGKRAEIFDNLHLPKYYTPDFYIKVWTIGRTHIILSYSLQNKYKHKIYIRYLDAYHKFHPPEKLMHLYEKMPGNGYVRKKGL